MATEVFDRLKGHARNLLMENDEIFEEIKSLVKSGKSRLVLNIYDFNSISADFSTRMIVDPFTFFPPCEEAFSEAYRANLDGDASKDGPTKMVQPSQKSVQPRLGVTGWLGSHTVSPRGLQARLVNKLVSVEGIVTRASLIRSKLVTSTQVAEESRKLVTRVHTDSMSSSRDKNQQLTQPSKDVDGNTFKMEIGLCEYKDFQRFTIQEMPENSPSGELPRSVEVIAEEDLTDGVKPGDRVRVFGIFRAISHKEQGRLSGMTKVFIISNNIEQLQADVLSPDINPVEIREMRALAERKDAFEVLARSLAPSICGHGQIKKGMLLQLLGGQRKDLKENIRLRGDIHVLLIGDPSCGKSQLLRFMLNIAPLALSTTGRGSSGVGLTAAVTGDRDTGERRLEAGAMVLADMGVVCIDEFDKMSPEDRVAIHEVMEQQTVTISKAGIQTSLNARCSVLAAANPLYGVFDEAVDLKKQIAFPDSLLSRFDLIYVVRDSQTVEQDRVVCRQVLSQIRHRETSGVGGRAAGHSDRLNQGIIQPPVMAGDHRGTDGSIWVKHSAAGSENAKEMVTVEFLRKYIFFCKNHCRAPTLGDESTEVIAAFYSELRQKFAPKGNTRQKNLSIPTARTLEACIRLATAHAKLKMHSVIDKDDVRVAKSLLLYTLCGESAELDAAGENSDESSSDDSETERTRKPSNRRKEKETTETCPPGDGDDTGRKRSRLVSDEQAQDALQSLSIDPDTPGKGKRRRVKPSAKSKTAPRPAKDTPPAAAAVRAVQKILGEIHLETSMDSFPISRLLDLVNEKIENSTDRYSAEEFASIAVVLSEQNKLMIAEEMIWFI